VARSLLFITPPQPLGSILLVRPRPQPCELEPHFASEGWTPQVDSFVRKFRAGAYLRGAAPPAMLPQCNDVLGCALSVPRHIRAFLPAVSVSPHDEPHGGAEGGEGGAPEGTLTVTAVADAMRRAREVDWTVEALAGACEHEDDVVGTTAPPPPPKASRYKCGECSAPSGLSPTATVSLLPLPSALTCRTHSRCVCSTWGGGAGGAVRGGLRARPDGGTSGHGCVRRDGGAVSRSGHRRTGGPGAQHVRCAAISLVPSTSHTSSIALFALLLLKKRAVAPQRRQC